jgi:hypothetical protein
MTMDPTYQNWHRTADALHYRIRDAIDMPDHPAARAIREQMDHLIDDCEQRKHPRNIEERIKAIMRLIEPARNGSQPFISVHDAVSFHDDLEDLRRALREHPNY